MKSLAKKEERSALWKHCKEKHNSEMHIFEMNVTDSYSNDAMLRQISEGVQLNSTSTQLQLYSFTFNLQLHDRFHPRIGEPNRGRGRDTQI